MGCGVYSALWLLPGSCQWREAETFDAVQRAPSADFLHGFSNHRERPFEDLKKSALFHELKKILRMQLGKTAEMGDLCFFS